MYQINASKRIGVVLPKKGTKKMNFFKRWLLKLLRDSEKELMPSVIGREQMGIDQPDRAIRFTVYYANGGRVVELHKYDRKTDRSHQNLYVITEDKNFGEELDKIITMESLR